MRNDGSKALSCQAYHEATEAVRMSVFVQSGESKRTDYDSRSTWDRLLDAGSTPARSIICTEEGLNEVGRSSDDICRVCPKLFGVSKKIAVLYMNKDIQYRYFYGIIRI